MKRGGKPGGGDRGRHGDRCDARVPIGRSGRRLPGFATGAPQITSPTWAGLQNVARGGFKNKGARKRAIKSTSKKRKEKETEREKESKFLLFLSFFLSEGMTSDPGPSSPVFQALDRLVRC